MFRSAAALLAMVTPRALDQNTAHGLGGGAEKVGAVLEAGISQSHPRLVYERGGLESVTRLLARHLRPCELAQFCIDQWEQLLAGTGIAVLDCFKNARDVSHGRTACAQPLP
jgi:hypothetical protein